MYDIQFLDAAIDDLSRLDGAIARRIVARLNWLVENLGGVEPIPLKGNLSGLFKLRVGDFRVLYQPLHQEQLLVVHQIGHRRDVYRD